MPEEERHCKPRMLLRLRLLLLLLRLLLLLLLVIAVGYVFHRYFCRCCWNERIQNPAKFSVNRTGIETIRVSWLEQSTVYHDGVYDWLRHSINEVVIATTAFSKKKPKNSAGI